ncbi:MAG: TIGR02206 family membrane protein [Clostridia bacterium]|nr:TIGR02206 family membrane protein [Clostridia bacterium]
MSGAFEYKFYNEGFFGYSTEQDFRYWSLAHFLPIILLGVAIFLTFKYKDKIRSFKHEETLRFILGGLMIFNEAFYYWRLLYVGNGGSADPKQLLTYLPLQVCEWTAWLAAFMLMKKSRHLYDICFYVSLTLGLIPLFTPAVIMQAGPGYARYYQFWIEHLVPIYAIFYMMAVHNFRASYKRVYKPFAMLGILATFAIIANTKIENANFMYLASGTDGDSIANLLPESIPVRILLYLGILIVLFALLSLPEILSEIKKKRSANTKQIECTEKTQE